jgi:hypothetical protein
VVQKHPELGPAQEVDTFVSGPPKGGSGPPPPPDSRSATAAPLASSALRSPESAGAPKTPWAFVALLLGVAAIGMALTMAVRGRTTASDASVGPAVSASPFAGAPLTRRGFTLLVDSSPSGAEVVEGVDVLGRTPMQISVDNEAARQKARRWTLRLPGYQPYSIVQGESEENVRILAPLSASENEKADRPSMTAVAPNLISPAHPAPPLKPGLHAAPKGAATAAAAPAGASPPIAPAPVQPNTGAPPVAPDIRLQR